MDEANGSVAATVRAYIEAHPPVREALAQGIVNLSALSRKIKDETGLRRTEAITTALRRQDVARGTSRAVEQALRGSRLEIRSHVGMVSYRADWALLERLARAMAAFDQERVHVFHGWEDLTIVADEGVLGDLENRLGRQERLERRDGLVELNLRSADASVPGFLAAVTGAIAGRGINLIDAVSCREDHILLVEQGDLPDAVAALERIRNDVRNDD